MKEKAILIDPRGDCNNNYYLGLVSSLAKLVDLTVVSRKCDNCSIVNIEHYAMFSSLKVRNTLYKSIRGLNYIISWFKILKMLKKNTYQTIHIQWLLFYKADIYFLRKIKKHFNSNIVLTAHNVFPHINGNKYLTQLDKIYNIVDKIVLHGTEIQKEFTDNFPDFSNKIVIQMHGIYYNQSTDYLIRNIDDNIVEKVNNFQRIYLFSGLIFYNKGVDRLMRIWREKFHDSSTLLIVSGEVKETYDELENEINMISRGNTVFLPGYSSNDLFNYLMNVCDLLILPYRHASVSGLIFTASNFKKPVLATRTGSISEYIKHNDSGFIVENTDEDIFNMLKEIESNYTKESLAVIGQSLARSINEAYNWDNIATKLVNQAYNNEE